MSGFTCVDFFFLFLPAAISSSCAFIPKTKPEGLLFHPCLLYFCLCVPTATTLHEGCCTFSLNDENVYCCGLALTNLSEGASFCTCTVDIVQHTATAATLDTYFREGTASAQVERPETHRFTKKTLDHLDHMRYVT